jgi:predicted HD phosphohydrolase
MSQPTKLSLEQQFSIRSFQTQVEQMSREQAQDFLIKLYEQMIVRENMYKAFLKHQWGLGDNPFAKTE